MSDQNSTQISILPYPTTSDPEAWKVYWQAQNQPWRTEPEIDVERQRYLAERRNITPDWEQGIFPFRSIKLNRADVEWLLATLDNGRGPVDWNDESQREREGLDLRGADLDQADLSSLPLASMQAGLTGTVWYLASLEQVKMAAIQMEGTRLVQTYLEGAKLNFGNLRKANLKGADLTSAELMNATLEEAYLSEAILRGATFKYAHLEGASLRRAHLDGISTPPADLRGALFDRATSFKGTILGNKEHGYVRLADASWDNTNLSVIDWEPIDMLGDEHDAYQQVLENGAKKDKSRLLKKFQAAVRANRQLAVVLQAQGLNEVAIRFAYQAQKLQRAIFLHQRKFGKYLFSGFLDLLTGYGYKPLRSFLAYLLVITAFATAYFIIGRTVGPSLSPLGSFVFSMTSFHGRGFFPGGIRLDDPLTVLAALEAFVGLLIEVTFIATLTQRLFGK